MTNVEDILTQRKQLAAKEPKNKEGVQKKTSDDPKVMKNVETKSAKDLSKAAPRADIKTEQKIISVPHKVSAPIKAPEKPKQQMGNMVVKMEELKKHNNVHDAWTAIHGEVFDITDFIRRHPGGPAAMHKVMGQDGTKLFGRQV